MSIAYSHKQPHTATCLRAARGRQTTRCACTAASDCQPRRVGPEGGASNPVVDTYVHASMYVYEQIYTYILHIYVCLHTYYTSIYVIEPSGRCLCAYIDVRSKYSTYMKV